MEILHDARLCEKMINLKHIKILVSFNHQMMELYEDQAAMLSTSACFLLLSKR